VAGDTVSNSSSDETPLITPSTPTPMIADLFATGSGSGSSSALPRVIAVEGEIGAGKSTLVRLFAEHLRERYHLRVQTVLEPVLEWQDLGILQAFYADPQQYAFPFQVYAYNTRLEAVKRAARQIDAAGGVDVVLMERSVYTDRWIFKEQQPAESIDKLKSRIYDHWWDSRIQEMPFRIDTFVYLKPTMTQCMQRVRRRAREGEIHDSNTAVGDEAAHDDDGVSAAYQRTLRTAHERFLEHDEFEVMQQLGAQVEIVEGVDADDDFTADPHRSAMMDRLAARLRLALPAI
jgi:deoxyadenosine/deoxycytidine kinase